MEHSILVLLHVIGASVWVGGHLVLVTTVLPDAMRRKDVEFLLKFEAMFEKIGIPMLILQVLTGIRFAMIYAPSVATWFGFGNRLQTTITVKLALILCTLVLALDARRLIKHRVTSENIRSLGWHIIAVSVIALLLLSFGVNFITGLFF